MERTCIFQKITTESEREIEENKEGEKVITREEGKRLKLRERKREVTEG